MTTEILYLAWNRLAFTQVSFGLLLEHTDWSLVDRLVVYDDGSKDGTAEWLRCVVGDCIAAQHLGISIADLGAEVELRETKHGSPVEVMIDYLGRTDCDVFAKIDSDIAVPDGWLPCSLAVMDRNPELDLLGLAAGWTGTPMQRPSPVLFGYQKSSHIGGVGLMRTEAFRRHRDLWSHGRHGFTQWQHRHSDVKTGWLTPDMPVVQLDLIPDEPWRSLADYYCAKAWARPWPPYADESSSWWDWIPAPVTA